MFYVSAKAWDRMYNKADVYTRVVHDRGKNIDIPPDTNQFSRPALTALHG